MLGQGKQIGDIRIYNRDALLLLLYTETRAQIQTYS